jgi:trehalose-phosphatase
MSSPFFAAAADVGARIARAPHLLVCFDVEQTLLAPEGTPAQASEPLLRRLRKLNTHPRMTIVLLSSRNRAELQAQVGIPGLVYVGNLGLEISGDGFLFVEPTAAGYADELAQLGARLAAKLANIAGARVENKGLIIRILAPGAADPGGEEVRRVLHETLATTNHPYHLTNRDNVYEVRPRVPWTKAHAVAWIKDHLDKPQLQVIYVSDDAKDDETVAALPGAITVKVGGPAESLANYRLEGPADIQSFLNWLENLFPHK